ncbi:unnamed protein product, partial [Amoebophrya sp. A120]
SSGPKLLHSDNELHATRMNALVKPEFDFGAHFRSRSAEAEAATWSSCGKSLVRALLQGALRYHEGRSCLSHLGDAVLWQNQHQQSFAQTSASCFDDQNASRSFRFLGIGTGEAGQVVFEAAQNLFDRHGVLSTTTCGLPHVGDYARVQLRNYTGRGTANYKSQERSCHSLLLIQQVVVFEGGRDEGAEDNCGPTARILAVHQQQQNFEGGGGQKAELFLDDDTDTQTLIFPEAETSRSQVLDFTKAASSREPDLLDLFGGEETNGPQGDEVTAPAPRKDTLNPAADLGLPDDFFSPSTVGAEVGIAAAGKNQDKNHDD